MLLVVRIFTTVGVTSRARAEKPGRGTFTAEGVAPSFQKVSAWLTESSLSAEAMNMPTKTEQTATMNSIP